jgi:hypothetical protein
VYRKNRGSPCISYYSANESVFAAAGKWILSAQYLHDSIKHGSWVDEEPYEWTKEKADAVDIIHKDLLCAPSRCRQKKGCKPFLQWRVAFLVRNVARKNVYER